MVDFLRCNACFSGPSKETPFSFTTCCHILCIHCLNKGAVKNNVCQLCKKQCQMVKLDDNAKPEVKQFFKDVNPSLKQLIQISDFQTKNRKMLINNFVQKISKLQKENKALKAQIENIMKQVGGRRQIATVTPDDHVIDPKQNIYSQRNEYPQRHEINYTQQPRSTYPRQNDNLLNRNLSQNQYIPKREFMSGSLKSEFDTPFEIKREHMMSSHNPISVGPATENVRDIPFQTKMKGNASMGRQNHSNRITLPVDINKKPSPYFNSKSGSTIRSVTPNRGFRNYNRIS